MRIVPDRTSAQIVLIGQFQLDLLSPQKMAQAQLLGLKESEAAEVRSADDAIVDFSTDWCRVFALPERLVLMSQQAPWIRLSDLCLKMFTEVDTTSVIHFMGINRTVQFETGSMKARDKLGRDLAPREVWGEWGKVLDTDEGKGESGLSTMTMRQGHGLSDRTSGYIETRISSGPGSSVVVTVNDHYDTAEKKDGRKELMRVLANNFESSIKRSDWIVDQIMQRVRS